MGFSYPVPLSIHAVMNRIAQDRRGMRESWIDARQAIEEAQRTSQFTKPQIEELGRDIEFRRRFRDAMLDAILEAAMLSTGTILGNIQLLEPESGRLVIHTFRGFREPFLEFFNRVESGQAACGAALRSRTRQIVEDTANSEIFLGSPSLEVLLDAGVRAVQSTPLTATSGQVVGMLSTHYRIPHRPSVNDLHVIDYFARRAGMVVEWSKNSQE
jgi:GAF domain-containing protein